MKTLFKKSLLSTISLIVVLLGIGIFYPIIDKKVEAAFHAVQSPSTQLYSGISSSATSARLRNFNDIYGNKLTMAMFGSVGYVTFEPGVSGKEEVASFTGITDNGDGTQTITGLIRGLLGRYPYGTGGTAHSHGSNTYVVVSNTGEFYNKFSIKENNETITGTWTYSSTTPPRYNGTPILTGNDLYFATVAYVNALASQGAATSSESTAGLVELATQAEMASSTDLGADNPLVLQAKYATSSPDGTTASGLYAVVSKINGKISQLWLDLTEDIDFLGNVTIPADNSAGGFVPIGTVLTYASSSAPSGWLLADGTAYATTTYSSLFAIVGYSYGGNGTSTFAVPNLSGKVAVGYGSATTTYDTMGETGGEDKHVLTVAELAAHTHPTSDLLTNGAALYGFSRAAVNNVNTYYRTGSAGGNIAHNNMQPFIVLNYIIKY